LTPKYQPYGYELLAIPQPKLAAVLINSGMRTYPGRIAYHFGWGLQTLHPEGSMAEFCSCPDSSTMVVRGDLVVGADGLHSRTRAELESKTGSFRATLHSAPAGRHIRYALLALVNSLHVASAS
jgi:2-polyprenyl-6-methoxyphenol hydroxylase-like FAD-dependent oxidoreductase